MDKEYIKSRDKYPDYKPKIDFEVLKGYLHDLKKLFDENDIPFFLFFGTLVGAIREQDFIIIDHDADVAVMARDTQKILNLRPQLKEMGYYMAVAGRVKNAGVPSMFYIAKHGRPEKVDIYNLILFEGKRWWVRHVNRKEEGPKEYSLPFDTEYFDEPYMIEFKGEQYRVPNPPEDLLSTLWKTWWIPKGGQVGDIEKTFKYEPGTIGNDEREI